MFALLALGVETIVSPNIVYIFWGQLEAKQIQALSLIHLLQGYKSIQML